MALLVASLCNMGKTVDYLGGFSIGYYPKQKQKCNLISTVIIKVKNRYLSIPSFFDLDLNRRRQT